MDSSLPSDEEIKTAVFEWLKTVDATQVTRKDLKQQIESNHGWNLDDKKDILKSSLLEFFEEQAEASDEDVETADDLPKKKGGGGGFSAPVQLSDKLSEFFDGEHTLPRKEVTKKLWAYIKEHNLQNPDDRRVILCDEKLQRVLGTKKVNMFKLTKLISQHLKAVSELQSGVLPEKMFAVRKTKPATAAAAAPANAKKTATKRKRVCGPRARTNGMELCPALSDFLGYKVLPRTQVCKLMWDYIKANNLQKESDRRVIQCDDRMRQVFNQDEFTMFAMQKHLAQLYTKTDKLIDEEYMTVWAARDEEEAANQQEEENSSSTSKKKRR